MKVTAEKFIEVWANAFNDGRNMAWVARELGLDHDSVRTRAKSLRKRGVKLPDLTKYRASESKRLNELLNRRLES